MENIVYGYVTLETLAQLGEEPYLDQLKILVAGDTVRRGARPQRRRRASRRWLEPRAIRCAAWTCPSPGKHPHADIMGLLLLAMSRFGLFVLVPERHPGREPADRAPGLAGPADRRDEGDRRNPLADRRDLPRPGAAPGTGRRCSSPFRSGLLGAAACSAATWPSSSTSTSRASRVPLWVYLLVALVGLLVPLLAAAYPVVEGQRRLGSRGARGLRGRAARLRDDRLRPRARRWRAEPPAAARGAQQLPAARAPRPHPRDPGRRRALLHVGAQRAGVDGPHPRPAVRLRAVRPALSASPALARSKRSSGRVRSTPGVVRAEGWITTEASTRHPRESGASSAAGGAHRPLPAVELSRPALRPRDPSRGAACARRHRRPGRERRARREGTRMKVGGEVRAADGPAESPGGSWA